MDKMQKSENFPFREEDGKLLVGAARDSITNYLENNKIQVSKVLLEDKRFEKKLGCFVTLKANDKERSLRGCIGFPEPTYKLSRALTEASIASAVDDPRFPPVRLRELDSLLIEISILTQPTLIKQDSVRELPKLIDVGRDGLIMRWSFGSGLLLPQVATEEHWDAEEFLMHLSMKAGAPPDQWLVPGTEVLKFQAEVFSEVEPGGDVRLESDS